MLLEVDGKTTTTFSYLELYKEKASHHELFLCTDAESPSLPASRRAFQCIEGLQHAAVKPTLRHACSARMVATLGLTSFLRYESSKGVLLLPDPDVIGMSCLARIWHAVTLG